MNIRRASDIVLVAILLVPPWATLLLASYWIFVDDTAPVVVNYQHPRFLRYPVDNRTAAPAAEVDSVASGAPLFIYREWCQTSRDITGESASEWVADHIMWPAPKQRVPDLGIGCYTRSVGLPAPDTQTERTFAFVPRLVFNVNPLVRRELVLPPMTVTVLPHDFDGDAASARSKSNLKGAP